METVNYMILGFAVIFSALSLHLASLYWRNQNLRRDLELLEKMQLGSRRAAHKRKRTRRG